MMKYIIYTIGLFSILLITACVKDKGSLPEEEPVNICDSLNVKYSDTISSIISTHCTNLGCHVSGGSGNGFLNTYAGVKAKVDNGALKNRVITLGTMPPAGPLSDEVKQKIQCWIDAGAPNN